MLRCAYIIFASLCLINAPTIAQSALAKAKVAQETARDLACKYRSSVSVDKEFGLMTLKAAKNGNDSGVITLINCSTRKIISLRDPSRSPRHLREFLYNPSSIVHLNNDTNEYGVLNFNKIEKNSPFDHTAYSKLQGWTGACIYEDLELITSNYQQPSDTRTTIIDIDVCKNQTLVITKPY